MDQGLLRNAQRMSRSSPPVYENPSIDHNTHRPVDNDQGHGGFQLDLPRSFSPGLAITPFSDEQPSGTNHVGTDAADPRESNGHASTAQHGKSSENPHSTSDIPTESVDTDDHTQPHPDTTQTSSMHPPRISLPLSDGASDYNDNRRTTFMIPDVNVHGAEDVHGHDASRDSVKLPEEPPKNQSLALDPRRDTRRLTLGLRPLPPDDPSDNPEQRANRIRSFYKEYFDESKTGRETYYEDYGPEFYDSVMYEDYYNPVPRPFAEPVGRRAMTPPPRAPPSFQGGPRHMPSGSLGGFSGLYSPGPRAFSSASGRLPGPRAPRRPVPPPAPLQELPTPHMMNDDAIMQATGFAPGKNFRDQREGRAETPLGGLRPFSPMTPVHSPLVSPFEELSAMPSP